MNTDIYYFTGTGNSLAVARKLAEKLGNARVISIARAVNGEKITAAARTGIVCPIYMHNIPRIVADFIKKLGNTDYAFLVLAGGGDPGSALRIAEKLFAGSGITLSAAFSVKMPSNYTPYGAAPLEEQQSFFRGAEEKIETIARTVEAGDRLIEKSGTGVIQRYIFPGLLYKLGYMNISGMDRSFTADEKCTSCGVCAGVCPVDNIVMEQGKPVWQGRCQQCYACLQWCPEQAIQAGKRTAGVERYHHPDVTVKDIVESAPRGADPPDRT